MTVTSGGSGGPPGWSWAYRTKPARPGRGWRLARVGCGGRGARGPSPAPGLQREPDGWRGLPRRPALWPRRQREASLGRRARKGRGRSSGEQSPGPAAATPRAPRGSDREREVRGESGPALRAAAGDPRAAAPETPTARPPPRAPRPRDRVPGSHPSVAGCGEAGCTPELGRVPLDLRLLVSPQVEMDLEAGRNGTVQCPRRAEGDFELGSSRYLTGSHRFPLRPSAGPSSALESGTSLSMPLCQGLLWSVLSKVLTVLKECHRGFFWNRLRNKRLPSKVSLPHSVRGDSMTICTV